MTHNGGIHLSLFSPSPARALLPNSKSGRTHTGIPPFRKVFRVCRLQGWAAEASQKDRPIFLIRLQLDFLFPDRDLHTSALANPRLARPSPIPLALQRGKRLRYSPAAYRSSTRQALPHDGRPASVRGSTREWIDLLSSSYLKESRESFDTALLVSVAMLDRVFFLIQLGMRSGQL